MASRPAGTDGSDAAYRMVIAQRYQAVTDLRGLIGRLRKAHVAILGVKLLWLAIGVPHGINYPTQMPFMAVAEVVGIALYNKAQMGLAKENIRTLKLFNLVQVGLAATQVLSSFLYHNQDDLPPTAKAPVSYSNLWIQASLDNGVPISERTLHKVVPAFELFLDLALALLLVMATFSTHKYIMCKVEDRKQQAADGAAKKTDGPAAGPAAVTAGDDGEEDEDAGRATAAAASARTRSRRRMA